MQFILLSSNYCRLNSQKNFHGIILFQMLCSVCQISMLLSDLCFLHVKISFHLDKTFTATLRWLKYGSSQNMVLVRRKSNFHYKHTYFRLFFAHQIILCYFQQPISLARSLINCKCEHLALYARRSTKYVLNYFEGFT